MIQSPIVFLSILMRLFLGPHKTGRLIKNHASLFTEILHPYLPNIYIAIYRKCYILIYRICTLLFTDYSSRNFQIEPINSKNGICDGRTIENLQLTPKCRLEKYFIGIMNYSSIINFQPVQKQHRKS